VAATAKALEMSAAQHGNHFTPTSFPENTSLRPFRIGITLVGVLNDMTFPARPKFRIIPTTAITLATLLVLAAAGCKSDSTNRTAAAALGPDPALANLAPVNESKPPAGQPTRALGQSTTYQPQQQGENYNQQDYNNDPNYDQGYNDGENRGQTAYESTQPPPPLEVSQQPPPPGPNYIWTPGYWGYNGSRYVWISGLWTAPPYVGALWTPPYWGHTGNRYRLHHGYWGRHVGYYGGIDYGSGYVGTGYYGGYWQGNNFYYNRSVNHIRTGLPFVYERQVEFSGRHYGYDPLIRVSFNGIGGITYAPRNYEYIAMREQHVPAFGIQIQTFHRAYGPRQGYYGEERIPVYVEHHDNGWHGERNAERDGFGRGEFHDNGRHEGWDRGHGEGHGEGRGHGEGHGHGHD
jgi:hypothetical protein